MDNSLVKLHKTSKSILNTNDIALLWKERNKNNLKAKIAYYVKKGDLLRIRRGVFAKEKNYNPKELAISIYSPAYISFETVLREAGIIFQHHNAIFAASYLTRDIRCGQYKIVYRKLKNEILTNQAGIIDKKYFRIATKERAFLDMLYLSRNYYFDHLDGLDWRQCFELVKIYNNKRLIRSLKEYAK